MLVGRGSVTDEGHSHGRLVDRIYFENNFACRLSGGRTMRRNELQTHASASLSAVRRRTIRAVQLQAVACTTAEVCDSAGGSAVRSPDDACAGASHRTTLCNSSPINAIAVEVVVPHATLLQHTVYLILMKKLYERQFLFR